MRIIEPTQQKSDQPTRKKKRFFLVPVFVLMIALPAFLVLSMVVEIPEEEVANQQLAAEPVNDVVVIDDPEPADTPVAGLRQFSGNEFRALYNQLLQPNVDKVDLPPPISGNDEADTRIRQIAEARGYRLRANPSVDLVLVDGYKLQQAVQTPWLELKENASKNGLDMSIVSAFRSVDEQRSLFLSRLQAEGVSISAVAAGLADKEINTVLVTSSIPGYSKHHTGYTFDLFCAGFAFDNFENSTCNEWLVANNYEQAKQYGFIPSYPPDADLQGPDPEAWEYVWVGTELLSL